MVNDVYDVRAYYWTLALVDLALEFCQGGVERIDH